MKKYILAFLGMTAICALAQTPDAPALTVASAKPKIAVPLIENKTGGAVSRIQAGTYREVNRPGSEEIPAGLQPNSDTGNWNNVPERNIEVVPSSGLRLPDAASEVATNAVKEALTNSDKFTVADYSPLVEGSLNEKRKKERVDEYRVTSGSGIDYIIVGSINNYRVRNEKSTVYGVRRQWNTITISLNIKLLKADSQEIIASKTMSEKVTRDIPQGVTAEEGLNDDWEEPLRKAIETAVPEFINSINVESGSGSMTPAEQTAAQKTVSFNVTSVPSGADVEYNNNFVGNTPCKVTAPAAPGILRVSLAGYEPWEKRLIPDTSMRISPTLKKIEKPLPVQPSQQAPATPQQSNSLLPSAPL